MAIAAGGIAGVLRSIGRGIVGSAVADATEVAGAGFSASSIAAEVGEATGGAVSRLGKSEGFKVTLETGRRTIVARIKPSGIFRVGIDGLGGVTREGTLSNNRGLTHLTAENAQEIIDIVNKAKDLINVPR